MSLSAMTPVEGVSYAFRAPQRPPLPTVVGVPHLHLEIGVALPFDTVTVEAVGEDRLPEFAIGAPAGETPEELDRAGLIRAGGGQALVRQHHRLRCHASSR